MSRGFFLWKNDLISKYSFKFVYQENNLLTQWSMRFNLKMCSPCLFPFCLNWRKIKNTEVYSLFLVCHIVWRKCRDRSNLHSSCHRSELGFPSFYQAVEDYEKCKQSSVSPSLQFSNSGESWASPSLMAPPPMRRAIIFWIL
jgi:hypothetical protein